MNKCGYDEPCVSYVEGDAQAVWDVDNQPQEPEPECSCGGDHPECGYGWDDDDSPFGG